jgi:agmatine deiminase
MSAPASHARPQASCPRDDGYRWPAEWEPHAATWLSWPHNAETWPGARIAAVERAFVDMVQALALHERVEINVGDEAMAERVRSLLAERDGALEARVGFHTIPTDDAWVRDHGPLFVTRNAAHHAAACEEDRAPMAIVDFEFQAWGGKYPPWDRDARVARAVADELGLPRYEPGCVLEPGGIDGNGRGALLTTESCLLHPNRGGGRARSRDELERILGETLSANRVVWLGDGIVGDDTDGHVDDITRFVAPDVVVTAVEPDAGDANHAPLAENLRRLSALRAESWPNLDIVLLPMPAPLMAGGDRLPASHANFYLANGVVLMPVFGGASDARAAAVLAECLPGREVVGIESADLVYGLGAVHCLTQQQPASPAAAADPRPAPEGGAPATR